MRTNAMEVRSEQWDASYGRGENFIFYPKEEVVKFLNRFVRKRTGIATFNDVLSFREPVRGLDFGCGIGRQTVLLREFGIDAYGVDISSRAIEAAKQLASHFGYDDMVEHFVIGDGRRVPFEDDFFDITISESALDSMSFELARVAMKEIDRVTTRIAFVSVIAGSDRKPSDFFGDELVETPHERGTVQSYYNAEKVNQLLRGTQFACTWCHEVVETAVPEVGGRERYLNRRLYLVLEK